MTLSTAVDIGFWFAAALTAISVAACAVVAWINRPWRVRSALSRLASWFRGAI